MRLRDAEPVAEFLRQQVHVFLDRRVEHGDLGLEIVHRVGLRRARARVGPDGFDVGLFAGAEHRGLAGGDIHAHQRGLVAAHGRLHQRGGARSFDADRGGGQRIFLAELEQAHPLAAGLAEDLAAFGQRLQRELRLEVEVEIVAGELLRVLLDQHALARWRVHFPEVVPLGHAVVEAHGHRRRASSTRGRRPAPACLCKE